MPEITTSIRFTTACLGSVRNAEGPVTFRRSPDGYVTLAPSAWTRALGYAADATGRNRKLAEEISVDPVIRRKPRTYRRFYRDHEFTEHEAYMPGDVINVSALLPAAITHTDFLDLLRVVGAYCGISPYGWGRKGYGRFEVVEPAPSEK